MTAARFGGLFYAPATLLPNSDRARYDIEVERTGRRCAALSEDWPITHSPGQDVTHTTTLRKEKKRAIGLEPA